MYFVKTPKIIQRIYSNIIWSIDDNDKSIYLTFDDGPTPHSTPFILDALSSFNAKASFFCVGENVKKYPQIFDRIKKEMHTVGHHSYSHLSGWNTENPAYFNDVHRAAKIVGTKLFRPPYGRIKRSQLKKLLPDYDMVMWDVLVGDFDEKMDAEKCFQNVIKNTQSGSILVLHDNKKTIEIIKVLLPNILHYFSDKGFNFKAIDQNVQLKSV